MGEAFITPANGIETLCYPCISRANVKLAFLESLFRVLLANCNRAFCSIRFDMDHGLGASRLKNRRERLAGVLHISLGGSRIGIRRRHCFFCCTPKPPSLTFFFTRNIKSWAGAACADSVSSEILLHVTGTNCIFLLTIRKISLNTKV